MEKRLGNCYISTGNRLFKSYKKNNRRYYRLISWNDKHCIICGRFIFKHNTSNRCYDCYRKNRKEQMRKYWFIYYHINELQVGDYI